MVTAETMEEAAVAQGLEAGMATVAATARGEEGFYEATGVGLPQGHH